MDVVSSHAICKLCHKIISLTYPQVVRKQTKFPVELTPHLIEHIDRVENKFVYCVYFNHLVAKITYKNNRERNYVLGRAYDFNFPQMMFITPSNMSSYSDELSAAGNIKDQYLLFDAIIRNNDIICDIITKSNYKCVICELEYDSQMPAGEIVSEHILRCHIKQLNLFFVKEPAARPAKICDIRAAALLLLRNKKMSILNKLVKLEDKNKLVCMLCNNNIQVHFRFTGDSWYMTCRVAKHFHLHSQSAFFSVVCGNAPCLVFENAKLCTREVYSINAGEMCSFPQFVFIHPVENIGPLRNAGHLVDDGETLTSIYNILTQLNYCCNICGEHFESGIPSIEMVAEHVKKCFCVIKK